METASAVASSAGPSGVAAVPLVLAPPSSLLPYNISLNFSSIFAAMIPTTDIFARIRRGLYTRHPMDQGRFPSPSVGFDSWGALETPNRPELETTARAASMDPFPGPWAFFTSWYMIGLFLMAVLLHRIQNVIIPSRMPHQRRQRQAYRFAPNFAPRYQSLRRIYELVLPLDFTRTTTRLILHFPSAYFLVRMLFIWGLLVLQTSEILPSWSALGWLRELVVWASAKNMADVCWQTFCAVCVAFLVEGFVKALDGMGSGFPINNSNPNTSPFNLVGYAFLLHIYSSPQTHAYKPLNEGPSRPDKHVLITITIPLLQLTIFHLLSISKRLSTHRLIPTALSSLLSLMHFHGTIISHYRRAHFSGALPSPTPTPTSGPHPRYSGNVNYPLLNYIPNFFETLLICMILLTLFLNALAQLLVRGRIDRVFSQLGVGYGSSLHDDDDASRGFFASLPFDEDFGVLLLRVGIASLEATGLKGWGNEVAPIPLPVKVNGKGRRSLTSARATPTHGTVRIGRMGASDVRYGVMDSTSTGPSSSSSSHKRVENIFPEYNSSASTSLRHRTPKSESKAKSKSKSKTPQSQQHYKRGFYNEVRVDLGNGDTAERRVRRWRWLRTFYAYLLALCGVLRGLVVFLLERARGRGWIGDEVKEVLDNTGRERGLREEGSEREGRVGMGGDGDGWGDEERRARVLYERFLRGEDISDDEEDGALEEEENEDDESEDGGEEEESGEEEAEAITLFTDFIRNGAASTSASTSAVGRRGASGGDGEMVLAHLVHGAQGSSSGPLTRRRWNALIQQQQGEVRERGRSWTDDEELEDDEAWGERGSWTIFDSDAERTAARGIAVACAICKSENREIICWPCRCLSMCDACREVMASKNSPNKHACPCCRQSVEGYSKIYIP